jgi:hypothetical protein
MAVFKLPHRWFHFFFTRRTRARYYVGGNIVEFYCSRCGVVFEVLENEVGKVDRVTSREPKSLCGEDY